MRYHSICYVRASCVSLYSYSILTNCVTFETIACFIRLAVAAATTFIDHNHDFGILVRNIGRVTPGFLWWTRHDGKIIIAIVPDRFFLSGLQLSNRGHILRTAGLCLITRTKLRIVLTIGRTIAMVVRRRIRTIYMGRATGLRVGTLALVPIEGTIIGTITNGEGVRTLDEGIRDPVVIRIVHFVRIIVFATREGVRTRTPRLGIGHTIPTAIAITIFAATRDRSLRHGGGIIILFYG